MLRRLLSVLLFGAILLPLIAPMLSVGGTAQSIVPACCRREGRHHCAMSEADRAKLMGEVAGEARWGAACDMAPYRQAALGAIHLQVLASGAGGTQVAVAVGSPSAAEQAECLRRIAFDRARQKRGPPRLFS